PLLPSRRRSLFFLATSMIIFSSKAYNILRLIPCVRATVTDKTVDPFLCLVEDCKLQTIDSGSSHHKTVYGSKEDNNTALRFFSEIQITEDQKLESLASVVVESLDTLSDSEQSTIREQLLNEFLPDDVCPQGAQSFMDAPQKLYQSDSNNRKSPDEAAPIFAIDDDALTDSFESQAKHNPQLDFEIPNLLSVNQLLESVLETAHQVGRISVSTAPDVSYKEMAHHCEALLLGKHQMMSHLMVMQHGQENLLSRTSQSVDVDKQMASYARVDGGFQVVGNPFLDPEAVAISKKSSGVSVPMLCASAYQHHPHSFLLPASSPYDNFLKAAGC
ncbi:unnamed protein product, partial [Ilex paraguariensis]